jgi:rhodanese-related sulfurtransferase
MNTLIVRVLFAVLLVSALQVVAGNKSIVQQVEKMSRQYDKKYSAVKHITVASYLKDQKKWVLVDIRPAKERKVSMIPGAITVKQLKSNLTLYKNRPILLYCTIGERSSVYALKLNAQGWKNVANLRGGVLAWAQTGKNFVTPDSKKTRKVHVYGSAWNVLPINYTGVW